MWLPVGSSNHHPVWPHNSMATYRKKHPGNETNLPVLRRMHCQRWWEPYPHKTGRLVSTPHCSESISSSFQGNRPWRIVAWGGAYSYGVTPRNNILIEAINFCWWYMQELAKYSNQGVSGGVWGGSSISQVIMIAFLTILKFHEI